MPSKNLLLSAVALCTGIAFGYATLPASPASAQRVEPAPLAAAPARSPAPARTASAAPAAEQVRWDRPKPGLNLRVLGPPRYELAPAEDRLLDLALNTNTNGGQLTVQLQPSEGLLLLGESEFVFDLDTSRKLTLPAWILAQAEGAHTLHIFAKHSSGDVRALAVAIDVGHGFTVAAARHPGEVAATAPGLINLPAEESIQ